MPNLEQHIYDLSHDDVVKELIDRCIIGRHQPFWLAAAQAINVMAERGYWCELKSPFSPGIDWSAGFTPHDTWIHINQMSGPYGPIAVLRAALLTAMRDEQEADDAR